MMAGCSACNTSALLMTDAAPALVVALPLHRDPLLSTQCTKQVKVRSVSNGQRLVVLEILP